MVKFFTNTFASAPMVGVFFENVLFNLAGSCLSYVGSEGSETRYGGGMWEDTVIGGEGMILVPEGSDGEEFRLQFPDNYSDVTTTRRAASAALTLMGLNHFASQMYDRNKDLAEKLFDRYEAMHCAVYYDSDFTEAEKSAITAFLD